MTLAPMERIRFAESGCWLWQGYKLRQGYGHLRWHGKMVLAHRLFAHMFIGFDLNSDSQVLHHCDCPPCVNPRHFFIGNNADNVRDRDAKRRQWQMRKTHCKRGHEFTLENTHVFLGGKRRYCRTCKRDASLNWYHEHSKENKNDGFDDH